MSKEHKIYRVGIDVGGTNTDAVLMCESQVICSWKQPTSPDVTEGVIGALQGLQSQSPEIWPLVRAVMVGTTHFLNAVLEAPTRRQLNSCAIFRLCHVPTSSSSASTAFNPFHCPPLCDWPQELVDSFHASVYMLPGGHQACGREELSPFDASLVRAAASQALKQGITSFAVSAPFSVVNPSHEHAAAQAIAASAAALGLPRPRITLSSQLGSLGLLERENASILNAALVDLAEKTVDALSDAIRLQWPPQQQGGGVALYLVSNDGTLCSAESSRRSPVLCFSAGATNSARGAAFLCAQSLNSSSDSSFNSTFDSSSNSTFDSSSLMDTSSAVVFDLGGTSCECCLLVDGFPRLSQKEVYVGGVRTNFRMPVVSSTALGGGSKIKGTVDAVTIGPESVRFKIRRKAVAFGGHTVTTSDAAVALGLCDLGISDDPELQARTRASLCALLGIPSEDEAALDAWLRLVQGSVHGTMQSMMDAVRTSAESLPVILVGGGSVIADPKMTLDGATRVIRPRFFEVANAIGAAIAQVAGQVDVVCSLEEEERVHREVEETAVAKCVAAGADPTSVQLHRFPDVHLPYVPGKMARVRRRAVGDLILGRVLPNHVVDDVFDTSLSSASSSSSSHTSTLSFDSLIPDVSPLQSLQPLREVPLRIKSFKELTIDPQRGWKLDALDIEYILLGQTLHGCGGGGSPSLLRLSLLRALQYADAEFYVVPPEILSDADLVGSSGCMGSPIIDLEKLFTASGGSIFQQHHDNSNQGDMPQLSAMAAFEAGGCNGTSVYLTASVKKIPILDADGMGRAFPELPMLLWLIFGAPVSPLNISDELGRRATFYAQDLAKMESLARHACVQFGMLVEIMLAPLPGRIIKQYSVPHTVSTCWRLGRAIIKARTMKQSIPDAILAVRGGRLLLQGKIVDLRREASGGFNSGQLVVQGLDEFQGQSISLDFKNELLIARSLPSNEVLACVPDLITLIQTDSGIPVLCEELNFGFRVSILHLPCHPLWLHPLAFARVSPQSFGYPSDVVYTPFPSPYPEQHSILTHSSSFQLNPEFNKD